MDDITLHDDTKYLFHWAANLNGVLALGKNGETWGVVTENRVLPQTLTYNLKNTEEPQTVKQNYLHYTSLFLFSLLWRTIP